MFFQLSLPSPTPGTDAGDDSATLDAHGPDTLTLPPARSGRQLRPYAVARLVPGSARSAKGRLRVGVATAPCAPVTYTAEQATAGCGADWPLQ